MRLSEYVIYGFPDSTRFRLRSILTRRILYIYWRGKVRSYSPGIHPFYEAAYFGIWINSCLFKPGIEIMLVLAGSYSDALTYRSIGSSQSNSLFSRSLRYTK